MLIYISISIIIILLGFLFEIVKKKERNIGITKGRVSVDYLFIIPSFFLLLFISSLRGDFTTDYNNYTYLFEIYSQFGLIDILKADLDQEIGFLILNKLIQILTDEEFYLFFITSLLTLICFYSQIRKYSSYIWLSILMFITIGVFYTSFNIIRQILAVAIIFAGSKYLYNRNLIKYILIIVLAATFHKASLLMLIFYFILNYRFNFIKFILFVLTLSISILYLDNIVHIILKYFYTSYSTESYGMSGLSFTNALLPICILLFILVHYKLLDFNDTKVNIWVNATVFYTFFSILGLEIQMIKRIAEFFSPYILLLVPLIISKIKNKELRAIYILIAVITMIFYNFITLSNTGYDPFYFIWENN